VIKEYQPRRANSASPLIHIVGTPISIVSMDLVLSTIAEWITEQGARYIVFRDVHGVMLARDDIQLRNAHDEADLVVPDGMPLVWAARAAGFGDATRVCGPDLLPAACAYGLPHGWRHYFYGGAPGVAEALVENLTKMFPGLIVAGTQCPPFRPLTPEENERACAAIRAAQPHLVWVGLGTPKQEIWMAVHRRECGGAILLGVGAAFNIYAGLTPRAPKWAQKYGLEWSYRLLHDPARLWKRYLVLAPMFALLAICELISRQRHRP
jgi:N-acetylglucosaminyldiphosphoundecaprenol N-acetyl-beta-D-mannosaminyltransferase